MLEDGGPGTGQRHVQTAGIPQARGGPHRVRVGHRGSDSDSAATGAFRSRSAAVRQPTRGGSPTKRRWPTRRQRLVHRPSGQAARTHRWCCSAATIRLLEARSTVTVLMGMTGKICLSAAQPHRQRGDQSHPDRRRLARSPWRSSRRADASSETAATALGWAARRRSSSWPRRSRFHPRRRTEAPKRGTIRC